MCADKKVPDIRFKGFSGEWLEATLSNIIDVRSGKDYKHLGKGNIPVYGTGGYMLSVDSALSNNEDAIGIGRKGTIDKPYILRAPFWTVDTLFYAVPFSDFNLDFLFCLFQKINWKKYDESTGVPSLSKIAINNVPVYATNEPEQTTIGNYFQKLDNLINQHQQKHDTLSNIKKAMLEKMFPKQGETVPEIRFKGFSGEWEEIQLEQIAGVRRGLTYKPSDISEDGIVVLRSSNINVDKFELRKDDVKVNQDAVKIGLIKNGDILITSANGSSNLVGKHTVVKGLIVNAVHGGFMLVATTKIPYFLNASMSTYWYQRFLSINVSGGNGAIGNIKGRALEEVRLYIPKQEEQIAIGNYFQKLDELINQHQQQITKLNHIKQACLSKMFI
ncbi:restriction endonuclease subunit S [Proteus penneri]|uniref:restriction endonuclease subunit S n=1 Tax=Proteus penneri TaxID=102862 RepID=UPI0034D74927